MNKKVNIRTENCSDASAIEKITVEAFKNHPHSNQTEHQIVEQLRDDGALFVSLVAELNGTIVGHIAFSKVKINNEFIQWYGLAPVSVQPGYQHQGVGSQLIRTGLQAIKDLGAKGCVLLGEPEFYCRFGFKSFNGLIFEGVPAEYFQALLINGELPSGKVKYHNAFS